jgi:Uma2 family endonuclease
MQIAGLSDKGLMALPEPTRFTINEYYALEAASDIKHEFVDGYIYGMADGSEAHSIIGANLVALLHAGRRGNLRTVTHNLNANRLCYTPIAGI